MWKIPEKMPAIWARSRVVCVAGGGVAGGCGGFYRGGLTEVPAGTIFGALMGEMVWEYAVSKTEAYKNWDIECFESIAESLLDTCLKNKDAVAQTYLCPRSGVFLEKPLETKDGFFNSKNVKLTEDSLDGYRFALALDACRLRFIRNVLSERKTISGEILFTAIELEKKLITRTDDLIEKVQEQFVLEMRRYRSRKNHQQVSSKLQKEIESCLSGNIPVQFTPYLSFVTNFK